MGLSGLAAPYTTAYAARVRPEGGGGDYGSDSGGYDHLGFGTLTATRVAASAPPGTLSGIYTLTNQMSGKSLDNGNVTTEGGTVVQWTPNGGAPQRWRLVKVG